MAQWVMAHFERRQFRKFVHFLRILFLSWTAAEGHAWWWLPIPSSTIACGWRPTTAGWTYLFSVGWRRSAGRDLDAGGAAGEGRGLGVAWAGRGNPLTTTTEITPRVKSAFARPPAAT